MGRPTEDERRDAAEVAALLAEVEGLADELLLADAEQRDRRSRRALLFVRLADLGVSQARIGRAAKVSKMAVSLVLKEVRGND